MEYFYYAAMFLFLFVGGILLLKWQMDCSIRKWNEEEALFERIRLAAQYCFERPRRQISKKTKKRKLASQRRLEALRAKAGYNRAVAVKQM